MYTQLLGIAERARRETKHRFQNLFAMLNGELLHVCWKDIKRRAAVGVDGVSASEYQVNLTANIKDLVQRVKEGRYRAQLVRRHYIPKGQGKLRPLGIPATEDKLLQLAAARLLGAIYETFCRVASDIALE